jgi:hypothetical protein
VVGVRHNDISNYRGIAILSAIAKLLELRTGHVRGSEGPSCGL